jgi:hypothetical protein
MSRITRGAASETDSTRAVGATARGSKQQTQAGRGGALRQLFRQAVRALTRSDPAPQKSGRRRQGETRARQFRKAARRLMRWPLRRANGTATLWLTDMFGWLNPWQQPAGDELADDRRQAGPNNHLSPRL